MSYIITFLVIFGFWIYAEHKRIHVLARIGGGLACMAFIWQATSAASHIIPAYEHSFHKSAMQQMELALTNGDTQTVLRALNTYNGIAATGTTYQAAMQMNHVLYESQKH
jgi:hypothetical protein